MFLCLKLRSAKERLKNCFYERKIRSQLLITFLLFIVFTIGSALCVCLQISYASSNHAFNSASAGIYGVNVQSIQTTSKILSEAVSDSLQVFGDFALSSAILESFLLNPKQVSLKNVDFLPRQMLVSGQVYREYDFVEGCQYPKCPRDYGNLEGRSRDSESIKYGSMEHSSLQIFSNTTKAARNDSAWDRLVSSDINIQRVINSLPMFDDEFNIVYHKAVNTSVLMYVAVSLVYSNHKYVNLFHSYPGSIKNDNNFDLWNREWFYRAPINSVYVHGPYSSIFSKDHVFTISTKRENTTGK